MKRIIVGGIVFRVMYAGVSPYVDHFKTQVYFEGMGLGRIAAILDGNTGITYEDGETTQTFTGYSYLSEIKYVDGETLVAILDHVLQPDEAAP